MGITLGERRLPMARTWPPADEDLSDLRSATADVDVPMPTLDHQDLLVDLYFTYVHPVLPVIHRQSFMSQYQAQWVTAMPLPWWQTVKCNIYTQQGI